MRNKKIALIGNEYLNHTHKKHELYLNHNMNEGSIHVLNKKIGNWDPLYKVPISYSLKTRPDDNS